MKIINVGIIAHVDVGKSTFVDALLRAQTPFLERSSDESLLIDSFDLEKERGITIFSKQCSIAINNTKINIVDTPGHADFSSEVERVMDVVDTVILLIDAVEGPMPQTRFVLQKALEKNLLPIVMINKVDKEARRIEEVLDETYQLFLDCNATEEQFNFPILYGITRDGLFGKSVETLSKNTDIIIEAMKNRIKGQEEHLDGNQFQVISLQDNPYFGRLAIGKVHHGSFKNNDKVTLFQEDIESQGRIKQLFTYDGLEFKKIDEAKAQDIVLIAGFDNIRIGDSLCSGNTISARNRIHIDPPRIGLTIFTNNSPFAGREGKFVTSTLIYERLVKESQFNVGIDVNRLSEGSFELVGRGLLQLSICVETMRREGYEFEVSKPITKMKMIHDKKYEPIERLEMWFNSTANGLLTDYLIRMKGEMLTSQFEGDSVHHTWLIPTRSLIGFSEIFTQLTKGEGSYSQTFEEYAPYKGELIQDTYGSMISQTNGKAMAFPMYNLKDHGDYYVVPTTDLYEGMIVGRVKNGSNMPVNITRNKRLNSYRGAGHAGKEDQLKLEPPFLLTFENALTMVKENERIEVTPQSIRMRISN